MQEMWEQNSPIETPTLQVLLVKQLQISDLDQDTELNLLEKEWLPILAHSHIGKASVSTHCRLTWSAGFELMNSW